MKDIISTVIIVFLISTCLSCKHSAEEIDSEGYKIYNVAIDAIVGSDSIWRKVLIPNHCPKELLKTRKDTLKCIKYSNWRDSIKTILDTAKLFIIVDPALKALTEYDMWLLKSTLSNKFVTNFLKNDTTGNELFRKLLQSDSLAKTIDIRKIKSKFNYLLYTNGSIPKKNDCREVGYISFSKVIFNQSLTKACLKTSFDCGGLCGYQIIYYLEKNWNKWEVTNRIGLSIS